MVKALQKKLEVRRVEMINVTAEHVNKGIYELFTQVLAFERTPNVTNYQFGQNMDMSILGQSYLNASLDMSLLERKDKKGIIPVKMSPNLDLNVEKLTGLIILILNYLSIKDFKISQYMEPILESSESKLNTLFVLLKDSTLQSENSPGAVISAFVILDNLLSKFIILFEKFISNLKTGIFKRFYKAIKSKFLR